MKAYVETRSQKAKGRFPKCGPDCYVAVQIVPDGVQKLVRLDESAAVKRGINLIYCGSGYARAKGPRSLLGQALAKAHKIASEVNG